MDAFPVVTGELLMITKITTLPITQHYRHTTCVTSLSCTWKPIPFSTTQLYYITIDVRRHFSRLIEITCAYMYMYMYMCVDCVISAQMNVGWGINLGEFSNLLALWLQDILFAPLLLRSERLLEVLADISRQYTGQEMSTGSGKLRDLCLTSWRHHLLDRFYQYVHTSTVFECSNAN